MTIAFDLDDTLIPTTRDFSVGAKTMRFPFNLIFNEKLRIGTVSLLKALSLQHQIWIYTTSLRSESYIKLWFGILGIRLGGVINGPVHRRCTEKTAHQRFSKAPRYFNIDILVDDSAGVGLECYQQGSRFILVDPSDDDWADTVLKGITPYSES